MTDMEMNKETGGLDEVMKSALRRQEVPDGFAERVLARLAAQSSPQTPVRRESWLRFFSRPLVRWAALAAAATAMILGVHLYNLRRERAEGEAAKQRLMLALRIAGSKLQLAKAKVNEINQTGIQQVKE
jgi:hypothetical protein